MTMTHTTDTPSPSRLPLFRYFCPTCPASVEVADASAEVGHRCPKKMGRFVLWDREGES